MMREIFFRGDARHPDEIFKSGMAKRNPLWLWVSYIYNHPLPPITRRSSAVCFSKDFHAAVMFPAQSYIKHIWIYILDLDVSTVTNVQKDQYDFAAKLGSSGVPDALWPMYAQERAANSVKMGDIAGAMKVYREMANFETRRSRFKCLEYIENDYYEGSSQKIVKGAADGLISSTARGDTARGEQWLWTPREAKGIVKSNPSGI